MRIDATGALGPERDALVDLLRSLDPDDWERPTECPAWTVKGIALHVLGDDLSLLSRQRDRATNSLVLYAESNPGLDLGQLLDGFNELWVTAATFLSVPLVIELLGLSGAWTEAYYGESDPDDAPGEPVGWFGATGPSPMWQVIAREYVERWVHQHQIRRAVGRPPLDGPLADLAEQVALSGGAHRLPDLGAETGDEVEVRMGARPWTFRREADRWALTQAASPAPRAVLAIAADEVPALLTRGPNTASETTTLSGDVTLAAAVGAGLTP